MVQFFEVDECLAKSTVLKGLINDFPNPEAKLQTNEVDGKILSIVIDCLNRYENIKPKEIPKPLPSPDLKPILDKWDYDYISPLFLETFIDLVNAANYLGINELINLTSARLVSEKINCPIEDRFGIIPGIIEEEMAEYDKYPLD